MSVVMGLSHVLGLHCVTNELNERLMRFYGTDGFDRHTFVSWISEEAMPIIWPHCSTNT